MTKEVQLSTAEKVLLWQTVVAGIVLMLAVTALGAASFGEIVAHGGDAVEAMRFWYALSLLLALSVPWVILSVQYDEYAEKLWLHDSVVNYLMAVYFCMCTALYVCSSVYAWLSLDVFWHNGSGVTRAFFVFAYPLVTVVLFSSVVTLCVKAVKRRNRERRKEDPMFECCEMRNCRSCLCGCL